ncbi:glycosyltransferase family 4 protein [Acidimangrovimonas pyrenivorans]|uniref:Glycosyltransferase family 4 protein n=1 Tax=Acidimangrovimonas pyrenivorans TaxID=2030798 RepID=A0ABV7ACS2_9RHOB
MAAPPTLRFVSRKWPPAMGGMETYALRLSSELRRYARVDPIVLPGRPDGGVPGAFALLGFGAKAALRLLATRHPADITHVADLASWPLALAARLRAPRSRIALSAHGTDVSYAFRPGLRGRLYRAYLRLGARLLPRSVVVCNSTATAALARRLGFGNTPRVALATDLEPAPRGLPSRRILFAGRLLPQKGCGWFIREVLPQLAGDIALDVAGHVWDRDEAAALDNPRVRYLGVLDAETLARAYAGALCVVLPNIDGAHPSFEGFGLVAVEAAAAGGIVLAAAHSGLNDAVIDGVTGTKLPSGDAAAWAAAITDVAGWTPDQREAAATRASEAAREHFSWERVARETVAAYG